MAILTIYDISGIQKFIFSSNVLQENIGASNLIAEIFNKILPEKLEEVFSNDVRIDLTEEKLYFTENNLKAEIVYIGGGNTSVLFSDKEEMVKFNKIFTKHIVSKTAGELNIAFAYKETDLTDFSTDYKELLMQLAKNKIQNISTNFMQGIAITKEGVADMLPAIKNVDGEPISKATHIKKEFLKNSSFEEKYPLSIDSFAGKEGEQYIGVVHIDGNNMGKIIESFLEGINNYEEGVILLRKISKRIDEIYKNAFKNSIKNLEKGLNSIRDKIKFYKKDILPLRPVIQNGDDITYLINAKIAMKFTIDMLKEIDNKKLEFNNKSIPVSANAGIAYVKPHFPFYRSYELAEELCFSSKKKAKALNNGLYIGSWIDFHIQQNALTMHLSEIREREYNLSDMEKAEDIGKNGIEYNTYNLLWRPWSINNDIYNIEDLLKLINRIKDLPKNKVKEIRMAMSKSVASVEFHLEQMRSRGHNLPEFNDSKDLFRKNNITPYLDAIELLEYNVQY